LLINNNKFGNINFQAWKTFPDILKYINKRIGFKRTEFSGCSQSETSAKLRPLADLMSAASLTLQRHMSGPNLSPRNVRSYLKISDFNNITGFTEVSSHERGAL